MPLYMHTALSILREMGADKFSYSSTFYSPLYMRSINHFVSVFKSRLRNANFNPAQTAMIKLRTDLLDSYLGRGSALDIVSEFAPGKLVIVDLSDPFLSGEIFLQSSQPQSSLTKLDRSERCSFVRYYSRSIYGVDLPKWKSSGSVIFVSVSAPAHIFRLQSSTKRTNISQHHPLPAP